jgi:O-succinylbenzoate synthase
VVVVHHSLTQKADFTMVNLVALVAVVVEPTLVLQIQVAVQHQVKATQAVLELLTQPQMQVAVAGALAEQVATELTHQRLVTAAQEQPHQFLDHL